MNYEEIKRAIRDKDKEIKLLEKDILNQVKSLEKSKLDLQGLESKQQAEIENQKSVELERRKSEAVKDLEQEILDANADIAEVTNRYNTEKAKINKAEYMKDYEDDLEIIDDVRDLSNEVKSTLTDLLGERLNASLFKNLEDYKIDISSSDLQAYAKKKDATLKTLNKLKKQKNYNFYKKVDEILAKLNPCKDDDLNNEKKVRDSLIGYITLCGILSGTIMYFGSSIVFLSSLCVGFLNIRRAGTARKLLLDSKVLLDNIDTMYNKITQEVEEEVTESLAELEESYNSVVGEIQTKRSETEQKIKDEIAKVKENFVFDPSSIVDSYVISRKSKEREITSLDSNIIRSREKQQILEKELKDLYAQLDNALNDAKDSFISFNGKNKIFETSYTLDIIDNKLIKWEHPKTACLFLYEGSTSYVESFARLFIAETLSKFAPGFAQIEVVDTKYLGVYYRVFCKTNADPADKTRGPVVVYATEDSLEECIDNTHTTLIDRVSPITAETDNIDAYNTLMLDPTINGSCMQYIFMLMISASDGALLDNRMRRIYTQGSSMGIYPMLFLSINEFRKMGENALTFLEDEFNVYAIQEHKLSRISKNKIAEELNNK